MKIYVARALKGLISILFLVGVVALLNPQFNIWYPPKEFEVTPTGVMYYRDKTGAQLIKVVEWGKMGVFKLWGNIPKNMTAGIRYIFLAQLGHYGHRTSPTRAIFKVLEWEALDP